jgi:HK97 family phage prohead protease
MTTALEVRHAAVAWPDLDFEMRTVGDGMEFAGYAAVFDSRSEDLGGFRETIAPGAFTRSINAARNGAADIRMFWNHEPGRPLGSSKANLRLSEDSRGLVAEATLPDTTDGRDMAQLIRQKIVRSMSFGFNVPRKAPDGSPAEEWNSTRDQRLLRHVTLHEVSPVTGWPAYSATSASVRHLLGMVDWDSDDSIDNLVTSLTDDQRAAFRRHLVEPITTPDPYTADLIARLMAKKPAA